MINAAGSAVAGAWLRLLLYLDEADLDEELAGEEDAQLSNSSRARIGERSDQRAMDRKFKF